MSPQLYDDGPVTAETMAYADAVRLIERTRSRQLYLHVGTFASFAVQNPAKNELQGVVGSSPLNVSKRELLHFLKDAFPAHWQPKLSLRVGRSKRCVFIGHSPR